MHYLTHEEIQTELLSILNEFDQFARDNHLRYSLDSGTLLGAIRHKGFIPWDDDIDVMMPRSDFERMVKLTDKVPEDYGIAYLETDGTAFPFAKFVNYKIRAEEGRWPSKNCWPHGECFLWIDIFPVDGMSVDEAENLKDFERIQELKNRRLFQMYPASNPVLNVVKKIMQLFMNRATPIQSIIHSFTQVAVKYPFEESEWCRDLVWSTAPKARMRTADFDNLIPLEFCDRQFPAIPHWDEYLTSQYGNYMQLPPEDQQRSHNVTAWRI